MVIHPAPPRIGPRTEWKILLPREAADQLFAEARKVMAPDPHVRGPSDCGYTVESLYLDTPALACFRQGGDGGLPKYRIRRYLPDSGAMFLEEKIRRGDLVWKRRVPSNANEVRGVPLERESDHGRAAPGMAWYSARMKLLRLRPTLHIAYERRALSGPEGERLTLDNRMEASIASSGELDFPPAQPLTPFGTATVVEIKFTGAPTPLALQLRELAAAEPAANSKYRTGAEAVGLDRLGARR